VFGAGLIDDVDGYGKKLGEVKEAISFVKGAIGVIGGVVVVSSAIIGLDALRQDLRA
jgi:hypothetical protein